MKNVLRWRARSQIAVEQRIYRSEDEFDVNNLPLPIAIVSKDTTEFTDETIIPGVNYHYLVSAYVDGKESFSDPYLFDSTLSKLGPGPSTIIGHRELEGYFGEVTSDELITGNDLASLVGVTRGNSQNSTTNWLKFFIDDKIVFVSKKNIRYSIPWDVLNTANVINGSRIITIGQYQYKIGILKGLNPDTSIPFAVGSDVPSGLNSEWNRLMYPVASDEGIREDRQKHSQTIDNWANFPQDDSVDGLNITAGNGRHSWTQETNPTETSRRVGRGDSSVTYLSSTSSSTTAAHCGWRPVLELATL